MKVSSVVLAVFGCVLGWLVVLAGPAAANPDDSSGDGSGSGGCPAGGCVNVYTPEDTGGSTKQKKSNPPGDSSGHSSGSDGSDGHSDSGGCGSGCGGHSEKTRTKEPDAPEVIVIPREETPRSVPVRPRQPVAPVDPGGAFVPADQPPAVVPVLEQTAVSRGAGEVVPVAELTANGEPAADGDSSGWQWAVPSAVAAAIGGVLAFAGAGAGASGASGPGFGGPTSGFTRAALGGAVSAGPPVNAAPDLRQLAWDWGGHALGGSVLAVPLVLGNPLTWTTAAVGVGLIAASEVKRRFWPGKPPTVNDMVGGNPYQRAQAAGNAGLGETVRGAHGNDAVAGELGPTGNTSTTWAESQQQVQRDTGGQTQSYGEVRRDLDR